MSPVLRSLRATRLGLVTLVAINLVFVHLTGAVDPAWLAPLFLATLSAPWTGGLRESRMWCALWNVGVVATFALLVHDAVTFGPRQLLEDGMTLAAFCQVHLLNVLRDEQRSDLLFFNSFLITVVTSFFAQDLAFSLVFAVWSFAFVAALALAHDHGRRPPWVVLREAAARGVVVLVATGLAFAFWPRDFRRPGLVDDALLLGGLGNAAQVGFAEKIDLRRSSHVTVSERVVLRARLTKGRADDVPRHWRGATLDAWDGRGWITLPSGGRTPRVEREWRRDANGAWTRDELGAESVVTIEAEDSGLRRLFLPIEATRLRVTSANDVDAVVPRPDGNFVRLPNGDHPPTWELWIHRGLVPHDDVEPRMVLRWLAIDRRDPRCVPVVAHALVAELRRVLPADATPTAIAQATRDLLASRYGYLAPGHQGAAASFDEFLSGQAPGHCEFFATALAVLLRLQNVPCRVATGYLAHEWTADRRTLVVRESDAHAWVEVFDRSRGWYALDATPASDDAGEGVGAWFDALRSALHDAWTAVTTFDATRRRALLDGLVALPERCLAVSTRHPAAASGIACGVVLFVILRRRRRGDRAVLEYERCLRRLRIARRSEETPRELLDRVAREGRLQPGGYRRLAAATARHETARFAVTIQEPKPC
ncbi:MAG: DUF3488 domain-containing protein [Planctomycetes bacterium]|nr:DUF3488 domain-containing protein [Planctomycetota bacterium]